MISGKTNSGFEFTCDDRIMDDWEFLEAITGGTAGEEIRGMKIFLGAEQLEKLKAHVRDKDGRISFKAMDKEFGEMLMAANGKN